MIIKDIYRDPILKYPLTDNEHKEVDNAWKFLEPFTKQFQFISDYREHVINSISKKYTSDEFLFYESIINKMYWNLRWIIFPMWIKKMDREEYKNFIETQAVRYGGYKEIPNSLTLCKYQKYVNNEDLRDKIEDEINNGRNFYRSFINKLILVDKRNKVLITRPMEGSSYIFSKNFFNLQTFTILFDREKYEEIMRDPYLIRDYNIDLSKYYYQYDYGFPNLNPCVYEHSSKDEKLKRIEKMYYTKGPKKARYWFKEL